MQQAGLMKLLCRTQNTSFYVYTSPKEVTDGLNGPAGFRRESVAEVWTRVTFESLIL